MTGKEEAMCSEETSAGDALLEWIRLHTTRNMPIDQYTPRLRILHHDDVAVGDVTMQWAETRMDNFLGLAPCDRLSQGDMEFAPCLLTPRCEGRQVTCAQSVQHRTVLFGQSVKSWIFLGHVAKEGLEENSGVEAEIEWRRGM